MVKCFHCNQLQCAEIHESEDGHAFAENAVDALSYLFAITGGRADRCQEEYRAIARRADEIISDLRDTIQDLRQRAYRARCSVDRELFSLEKIALDIKKPGANG